ncbi:MAG: tRNA preQ1(34) S-adenosylmethionine ribosyltransferase-isomerase QueA [Chloroflexi bacterium]|nr:tRNA preQ1(34) S-adenosylmethionine ribosyltransferase-isomerase QueA [Chloroflexota bacterium]
MGDGDGPLAATALRTSDFDYALPPELIAQRPIEPRDDARLLAVDRAGGAITHRRFFELGDLLQPGDLLVFNDSRVIPARLRARRVDTGGSAELLLLHRLDTQPSAGPASGGEALISIEGRGESWGEGREESRTPRSRISQTATSPTKGPALWRALARPAKRLKPGTRLRLEGGGDRHEVEIVERHGEGIVTVLIADEAAIEECGQAPLPPYIREPLADPERYQTVYARVTGSAAAPTAGLHFTRDLLRRLEEKGIELAFVTLHVGLDTFRPVEAEDPMRHRIHREYAVLGEETARRINEARAGGHRVVAVGTTTTRVLETAALGPELGRSQNAAEASGAAASSGPAQGVRKSIVAPFAGWTGLMILPGHEFRAVDALITNFHLPRSSLLMLVSAFAGKGLIDRTYAEAVRERYRFYSFGDAMMLG